MEIKKKLAATLKEKPQDESKLGFGHIFTDHMLVMPYDEGQGWHDPEIVPYGNIELSPAAMCLHYGQTVFEGLKAYRTADDKIQLFRPEENFKRLNRSNERLVIPELPVDLAMQCLTELLKWKRIGFHVWMGLLCIFVRLSSLLTHSLAYVRVHNIYL